MISNNDILMNLDILSYEGDWIHLVKESNEIEIANRIKATPTKNLEKILAGFISESAENETAQINFALREKLYRILNDDTSAEGNLHYKNKIFGYDRTNKNIHEKLTSKDSAEEWIADFVSSDDPKFKDKSKEDRIKMALGAYYSAVEKNETVSENRALKIIETITQERDKNILRFFIESEQPDINNSMLTINEKFKRFKFDLIESKISIGVKSILECIHETNSISNGTTLEGVWKQCENKNHLKLEFSDTHINVIFDKATKQINYPKQFKLL
jgi:hypothetical protein